MKVLGLSGSLRTGSSNGALLRVAATLAPEDMDFILYEALGELPHFNPDLDEEGAIPPPAVLRFRRALGAADGVVISCPEYAHGVPGSFKNALDWIVSSGELGGKPVVVLTGGPGVGQWARDSLIATLTVIEAQVVEAPLPVSSLRKLTDEHGKIQNAELTRSLTEALLGLSRAVSARGGGLARGESGQ